MNLVSSLVADKIDQGDLICRHYNPSLGVFALCFQQGIRVVHPNGRTTVWASYPYPCRPSAVYAGQEEVLVVGQSETSPIALWLSLSDNPLRCEWTQVVPLPPESGEATITGTLVPFQGRWLFCTPASRSPVVFDKGGAELSNALPTLPMFPSSTRFALAFWHDALHVLDLRSGRRIVLDTPKPRHTAFSQDDALLALVFSRPPRAAFYRLQWDLPAAAERATFSYDIFPRQIILRNGLAGIGLKAGGDNPIWFIYRQEALDGAIAPDARLTYGQGIPLSGNTIALCNNSRVIVFEDASIGFYPRIGSERPIACLSTAEAVTLLYPSGQIHLLDKRVGQHVPYELSLRAPRFLISPSHVYSTHDQDKIPLARGQQALAQVAL